MSVKVAIPTDDGIRIAQRFGRVSSFVVAEVGLGQIRNSERRTNPASSAAALSQARRQPERQQHDRHRLVGELLADCRCVIAASVGDSMRRMLSRRGIEIVITSEDLIDRTLALFTLAALRDESRADPEDDELGAAPEFDAPEGADEFDG